MNPGESSLAPTMPFFFVRTGDSDVPREFTDTAWFASIRPILESPGSVCASCEKPDHWHRCAVCALRSRALLRSDGLIKKNRGSSCADISCFLCSRDRRGVSGAEEGNGAVDANESEKNDDAAMGPLYLRRAFPRCWYRPSSPGFYLKIPASRWRAIFIHPPLIDTNENARLHTWSENITFNTWTYEISTYEISSFI